MRLGLRELLLLAAVVLFLLAIVLDANTGDLLALGLALLAAALLAGELQLGARGRLTDGEPQGGRPADGPPTSQPGPTADRGRF